MEHIEIDTEEDLLEESGHDKPTEIVKKEAEEGAEMFVDVVELKADDLIDSKNIVSIELPKVTVDMVNGRPSVKRSNIMVTLNDNPQVCSNLIKSINKGYMQFVLTTYLDVEKKEICDVWELEEAKIVGINFGQIVTVPQSEQRIVQCEIEFAKLSINGIKI